MKRIFIQILLFSLLHHYVMAQDTIVVQTLTFDSITTRRGVWDFPTENNFRKILMQYTLKCDIQTQHDQYPCGEWDYQTHNILYIHTGAYDSTLYFHPAFTFANDRSVDSVLVSNDTVYNYFSHQHAQVTYADTILLENAEIGLSDDYATEVFPAPYHSGRSQYLWRAEELLEEGFTQGLITGIKLYSLSFPHYTSHAMVRMANAEMDEISPINLIDQLDTVFYNNIDFAAEDWNDINFYEPFNWDGTSNIIIDFSYTDPGVEVTTFFFGNDPGFNCGIASGSDNFALDLDGSTDFLKLPADTYFNSDFTFEAWIYKRNNNVWSRVFDFGNGPNNNNVIVVLSNSGSGKFSFHVNNDSQNRSFTFEDVIPTNEWTHLSVTLTGPLTRVFINGEFVKLGLLQQPDDVPRSTNYIGRSNWANDNFADMLIDEFRIYNIALEETIIQEHYRQEIESPVTDQNLIVYFDFNEGAGDVIDRSAYNHHPESYGLPARYAINGPEIYLGFHQSNIRPWIQFERLESSNVNVTFEQIIDSIADSPTQLVLFENLNQPTISTDTILIWQAGNRYVYENWNIIDTVFIPFDEIIYNEDLPYYGEPFEVIEELEIGRFITPYGINLDLGPQGFTWVFDVTDYASFLQGSVDLGAGNQQELIDLKFEFIEGIPPRNVLQVDRIWDRFRSYSYKNLDDDISLPAITLPLLPEADEFRVKTRLTGHGHNSNTGEYPHCCEWKDNEHSLLVNGETVADWHIFQYHDCGLNPVYPQGGTWPGAREGWCPGDLVIDHDFEITPFVTGNEVILDYGITPVPPDNLGMGNGNYIIAMHLVQYDASNFSTDAEIYDVVTPGSADYYSRKNPVCYDPEIIIRNNGSSSLTTINFDYGVSGGLQQNYAWIGNIAPHCKDTIVLPVPYSAFWLGDTLQQFSVKVSSPNGMADEYADNDIYTTTFSLPDLFDDPFILQLKTNNQAYRYSLQIRDVLGNVIMEWKNMENNTIYRDTMNFPDGCYTVELIDAEDMGLTYWAYPEQGSGYLRFFNLDNVMIKSFNSDFGRSIFYTFNLGDVSYIRESNLENIVQIYPNPFTDDFQIIFNEINGQTNINVYNAQGQVVYSNILYLKTSEQVNVRLSDLPTGLYIVNVNQQNISIRKKIIKK